MGNIRAKVTLFAFKQDRTHQEGSISRKQKVSSNEECPLVIEHFSTNKPKVLEIQLFIPFCRISTVVYNHAYE